MTVDTNRRLELVDEHNLQFLDAALHDSQLLSTIPGPGDAGLLPTPEQTAVPESPMASFLESDKPAQELFVCPECNKPFPRHCDLNKHAKSHTRPFKCAVQTCKYYELGWPTAKELDRHVNDKHSLSPQTFPCQFEGCSYRSKRESNCKQHMEKAHGWTYVKSKTNGKRMLSPAGPRLKPEPGASASPLEKSLNPYLTPRSEQQPVFGSQPEIDFVLFSDDEEEETFEHLSPDQAYLPWNSPMTRLRMTENFLERFSEAYHSSDRPGHKDSLIDPRLSDAIHIDVSSQQGEDDKMFAQTGLSKPDLPVVITTQPAPAPGGTCESVNGSIFPQGAWSSTPLASHKRKRVSGIIEVPSESVHGLPIRHRRAISGASAQSKQLIRSSNKPLPKKEEDSDDEGMEPPNKKKRQLEETFGDNNMPDIFRFAHPEIYHRDNKEKYSPCHSDHKDISTLVRHLSRPAHRLRVTERLVSSFDIEDEDYIHPRVGVCRRCWTAFHDRCQFDAHINGACTKVSKGKKEKWRILYQAFTPITGDGHYLGESSGRLAVEDVRGDLASVPTSAPSPTTIELGLDLPDAAERDFVPMSEHRRVCEENQNYRNLFDTLVQHARLSGQVGLVEQAAALIRSQRQNLLTSGRCQADNAEPEPEVYHHHDIPSDRSSLVGHMDSQSTDVDPHGLMEDVQTLSRANSGLEEAESRSRLHHVPTEDVESVRDDASSAAQAWQPQPASNPDSGYHTHSKRPSVAQDELVPQLKGVGAATYDASNMASSSAVAGSSQQQPTLAAFASSEFSFIPSPQVDGLPLASQNEHGTLKAHDTTSEPMISGAMWDLMRDPFAGAGSSQTGSQTAGMTNLGAYVAGQAEDSVYAYNDLVDFDSDLQ